MFILGHFIGFSAYASHSVSLLNQQAPHRRQWRRSELLSAVSGLVGYCALYIMAFFSVVVSWVFLLSHEHTGWMRHDVLLGLPLFLSTSLSFYRCFFWLLDQKSTRVGERCYALSCRFVSFFLTPSPAQYCIYRLLSRRSYYALSALLLSWFPKLPLSCSSAFLSQLSTHLFQPSMWASCFFMFS